MVLVLNDKNGKKVGFPYAWNGIQTVFKREKNFRIHLIAIVLVIVMGIFFTLSLLEWLVIGLIITVVLVAEVLNSAIERTVDYISTDIHPDAKVIKDMAAGAVLIAAIGSIIIGLIIFIPKIYRFLF